MYTHYRDRSGPHSIHDARQYAWSRLVFGPGAPAPRMRPHPGMLPDVQFPDPPARTRSLLKRLLDTLRSRGAAPGNEIDTRDGAGQAERRGL